jgi:hypothetical protein
VIAVIIYFLSVVDALNIPTVDGLVNAFMQIKKPSEEGHNLHREDDTGAKL